jgi:hypothetical protein
VLATVGHKGRPWLAKVTIRQPPRNAAGPGGGVFGQVVEAEWEAEWEAARELTSKKLSRSSGWRVTVNSSTCFSAWTFPADVVDTCAVLSRATTCSEVSSMAHVRSPVAAEPKLSRQFRSCTVFHNHQRTPHTCTTSTLSTLRLAVSPNHLSYRTAPLASDDTLQSPTNAVVATSKRWPNQLNPTNHHCVLTLCFQTHFSKTWRH